MQDGTDGYTIEELASITGISVRTIRFYRQSGLIGAPERRGRNAFYSDEQLAQLRTVAGLRAQGLGLDAIARVLDDPDRSRHPLTNLIQLGNELRRPWIEDGEAILTEHEVLDTLGIDDPRAIPVLERYQVIVRLPHTTPTRWHVASVGQLQLAGQLTSVGVTDDLASESWALIRQRLGTLAQDLVELYASRPADSLPGWPSPDVVAETFDMLKPITLRAVELAFGVEMQRAVDDWVSRGGVFNSARARSGSAAPSDRPEPETPSAQ